jgi:hypothetical protein
MRAAAVVISLVALLMPTSPALADEQPADLVATWHATGEVPSTTKGGPGMAWQLEYRLAADGTFQMTGYPPIAVTGRWAVRERDGRKLRIVLTQQKMASGAWPDRDGWAELSADGKSLSWQDKTFRKK